MNNQNFPKSEAEQASTSQMAGKKRKSNFYPTINSKNTTNIFGSNILDIHCKPNRKDLLDKWAKKTSLIIQTNTEAYNDQNTVLFLVEHKTTGIVNNQLNTTHSLKDMQKHIKKKQ